MGSIKDRNGMDLVEAEDIKKRWQEYTEEFKKSTKSFPKPSALVTAPCGLSISDNTRALTNALKFIAPDFFCIKSIN